MALGNPLNLLSPQSLHLGNGHSIRYAWARLLLAEAEVVIPGVLCVSQDSSFLPSFHIGSGCPDPQAYAQSIADARVVFEMGAELGHRMHILDLGGSFPGVEDAKVRFEEVSGVTGVVLGWARVGGRATVILGSPLRVGPLYYVLRSVLCLDYLIINPVLQLSKLRLTEATSFTESMAGPAAHPALPGL